MYIEVVPNRGSRPAVLLREGWREDGKVQKRTLANLSDWPAPKIEALRAVLRGQTLGGPVQGSFEIVHSRPHGHVAAVLGTARALGLPRLLDRQDSAQRRRVLAMIAARILHPQSKLATARALESECGTSTLGEQLGIEESNEDDLYAAMDWLLERQPRIEQQLAKRHLQEGSLVLYDVSSTYFEGRCGPLAKLGHNRDDKKGKLQIVFGLLCSADGCPVAVEVFEGHTSDPTTLSTQIRKIRDRFGLQRVIWVGDRGLLTEARIREELRPVEGLEWISALRAPALRGLVESGALQLWLFDTETLGEITDPQYPGERLIICKNRQLAPERTRKRAELIAATERELERIVTATTRARRPLRGEAAIGVRVGKVLGRFKMAKHFTLEITAQSLRYARNPAAIAEEAALDGIYVLRTSVPASVLDRTQVVHAYKSLSHVERAFRSYKSVDLHVRPIHHHDPDRVRAHVFLCMLAYYLQWHMREKLAPLVFDDDDRASAQAKRTSVVEAAQRSDRALRKAATKRTAQDEFPAQSFATLLEHLATLTRNRIQPSAPGAPAFELLSRPTALQQRAFDLLGLAPGF
jgi:hypothetical protein